MLDTILTVFSAITPIFTIVFAGFLCRKTGWLTEEADQSLMRVVVNLLYPCLILAFVLGNESLRNPLSVVMPPLIGFTMVVFGYGFSLWAARVLRLGDERCQRSFSFATGMFNYGYFAIPVSLLLFGRETTGVLLVFNVGVEVALWAVGVAFVLGGTGSKQAVWKRVFSPPIIALLIALPLNFLGWDRHVPRFLFEAVDLLAACAVPLGVLLTGAVMADLMRELNPRIRPLQPLAGSVIRLLVLPPIFIAAAWLLPFSAELKAVVLIQAAMPCGILTVVLARHYGGDAAVAVKVIVASLIFSLATIPLWIAIGMPWLGLR